MESTKPIKRKWIVATSAILIAGAATALALPSGTAAANSGGIDAARAATKQYHDLRVARADGYKLFKDADGVQCIAQPGSGTMGIHFVNSALVGNASEAVKHPEAVIYEPEANGDVHLVAVEYVVLQSAWRQAGHTSAPSLFGKKFMAVSEPNRYGLPPFYALHAWIWKSNPRGMFNPWNPQVSCHGHA